MAQCDMCGAENASVHAKIEGTILNVCNRCTSFGEVIERKGFSQSKQQKQQPEQKKELAVISEEYALRIRAAREKLGLKQDEFAAKIGEKMSLLQKIENGETTLSVALAKKLEQFLQVTLITPYIEEKEDKARKDVDVELTIGDLMRQKMKK